MKKNAWRIMVATLALFMGLVTACSDGSDNSSGNTNPDPDPSATSEQVSLSIPLPLLVDNNGNIVNETGRIVPGANQALDAADARGANPLATNPPFPTNVAYGYGDLVRPDCTSLTCNVNWSSYIQPDFSLLVPGLLLEYNNPKTVGYWYGGYPRVSNMTFIPTTAGVASWTCDTFTKIPDPNLLYSEAPVCCVEYYKDRLPTTPATYNQYIDGVPQCVMQPTTYRLVYTGDDNNNCAVDPNSYDHPLAPLDGSEDIKIQISLWNGANSTPDIPSMIWNPTFTSGCVVGAFTEIIPDLLIDPTTPANGQQIWIAGQRQYYGVIPGITRVPAVGGWYLQRSTGPGTWGPLTHLVRVDDVATGSGVTWTAFMITAGNISTVDNRGEFVSFDQ